MHAWRWSLVGTRSMHRLWAAGAAIVMCLALGGMVVAADVHDEPTDPPRDIDHEVTSMAFGPDGTAWLTTRLGLVRWDPASESATLFGPADGLPASTVDQVAVASDGTVWAGSAEWLARFDGRWTAFTEFDGLDIVHLGGFAVGPDGTLWAAAYRSSGATTLLRFDGSSWTTSTAPPRDIEVYRIGVGPDGRVWAVAGGDVLAYSVDGWQVMTDPGDLPDTPWLRAVAADGSVWVTMGAECLSETGPCPDPGDGVARFDGRAWTVFTTADGLANVDANVVVGPQGTVWATHDLDPGKASRFDGTSWMTFDLPGPEGMWALAVAPDGSLWLGTSDGLARFDGETTTPLDIPAVAVPTDLPSFSLAKAGDPQTSPTALGVLSWQRYDVPGSGLWAMIDTPHGQAAIRETELRWSTEGTTWEGLLLSIAPTRLTLDGDDLIVLGYQGQEPAAVRLTWDGERWTEAGPLQVLDTVAGWISLAAFGPRGGVISDGSSIFVTTDGQDFLPAEGGPDLQLLSPGSKVCGGSWSGWTDMGPIAALVATADGYVALSPSHQGDAGRTPICEPLVWSSSDGSQWELTSAASPFGTDAWISDLAARDGRLVAVGGVRGSGGAVWVSDDGRTWDLLPVPFNEISRIGAGELGWMLLESGHGRSGDRGWVSADGRTWEALPDGLPNAFWAYVPASLVIGEDRILVSTLNTGVFVIGSLVP